MNMLYYRRLCFVKQINSFAFHKIKQNYTFQLLDSSATLCCKQCIETAIFLHKDLYIKRQPKEKKKEYSIHILAMSKQIKWKPW